MDWDMVEDFVVAILIIAFFFVMFGLLNNPNFIKRFPIARDMGKSVSKEEAK